MAAGQGLAAVPQQQRCRDPGGPWPNTPAGSPPAARHRSAAGCALGQGVQVGLGRRLFDTHLPELAMPRAIQFAGLPRPTACSRAPSRRAFADQEEFAAGQAGGQAGQQVVGQFAGLGQEQNGRVQAPVGARVSKRLRSGKRASNCACSPACQLSSPGPAVARRAGRRRAGRPAAAGREEVALAQQHFTARVHAGSGKWEILTGLGLAPHGLSARIAVHPCGARSAVSAGVDYSAGRARPSMPLRFRQLA